MADLSTGTSKSWDAEAIKPVQQVAKAGEVIFNQGEEADSAYLIEEGEVMLVQTVSGRKTELGRVKSKEMFGEMAVLDHSRRGATAVAVSTCRLVRIPRALFEKKVDETDRFVRGVLKVLVTNMRNSSKLFQRRPQSFRDQVLVVEDASLFIDAYRNSLPPELGAKLEDKVARLTALVAEFRELAETLPDSRQSAILESGERG